MKRLLIIFLGTLLLCGCGFHPRRAADIPPQLHTLHLKTSQPYNPLITQLKSMLTSLHIKLIKQPSNAPYTLHITNIVFSQTKPSITTTALAVTFTYSLRMTITITDAQGKIILPPKQLCALHSFSENASQVYTPGAAMLAKRELQRDIISQIYYVLISNNLRRLLCT